MQIRPLTEEEFDFILKKMKSSKTSKKTMFWIATKMLEASSIQTSGFLGPTIEKRYEKFRESDKIMLSVLKKLK